MNSVNLKQLLLEALKNTLPGEIAHKIMTPLSNDAFEQAKLNSSNYRQSAVSVIIYDNQIGEYEIILIQRPEYIGKHSGQVSFPGGKKEDSDFNILETAKRECFEEIGVFLTPEHYLGALTTVFIPVSLFQVEPHVFYLEQKPNIIADSYEVSEVFSIKLSQLIDDSSVKQKQIRISEHTQLKNVSYFDLENKVIWGATAVILSELKAIVKSISKPYSSHSHST